MHQYKEPKTLTLNGKPLGEIHYGINTYITRRSAKEHYYRKGLGYAMSIYILNILHAENIKRIRLIEYDRDDKDICVYEARVADFSILTPFQEKGNEQQKVLPLRLWRLINSHPE